MKKRVLPLLMASCMMATTISPVFGQEQSFDQLENSTFAQETEVPTEETVVSITIDGTTINYSSWDEAFVREIEGSKIVIKLNKDVDFTNTGVYSKQSQTHGIFLDFKTTNADVTLDLNGHNVTNHFKNGKHLARGLSVRMYGGTFKVVNSTNIPSTFDVDQLGRIHSRDNRLIIEFSFGDNIEAPTTDLDLKHVVSKYSDFYLGMNGGFKALQEDGTYNFYTSASDAVRNSKDNTAVLINDYTGDDNFSASSGDKGTIDLNGKTFTTLSDLFKLTDSNVELTIKNGTVKALSDYPTKDYPNVGFIGDESEGVLSSNIKLTLKNVNIESNYYRGFDFHGTDKNLHLTLDHSTLTMTREDSYGIYMPAKESSVTLKNSNIKAGTGIAVKGGTLNVEDSKISSNGQEYIPDQGHQSGFDETGDAIYVDGSYKFPIQINVKNSEIKSEHAKAMRDLFVAEGSKDTTIVAESGKFSSDVMKYVPDDKAALKVDSNYVIGTVQEVQKEVANAKDSVEILQGIDSIRVPGGVKVENKTEDKVTVNGTEVGKGETITTPAPSTGGGGSSTVKLEPVYRAYNPNNGEHLYTLDEKEYKHLASVGWHAEGVAFMAETEKEGQALYRVYNPNSGLHHYTTDETEKNTLVSLGWYDEKVAWYTNKKPQSAPVYRVYNINDGNHHYTMSKQEKDALVTLGWQFEGIAFRTAPIEK